MTFTGDGPDPTPVQRARTGLRVDGLTPDGTIARHPVGLAKVAFSSDGRLLDAVRRLCAIYLPVARAERAEVPEVCRSPG
jgi:hypothetical protein